MFVNETPAAPNAEALSQQATSTLPNKESTQEPAIPPPDSSTAVGSPTTLADVGSSSDPEANGLVLVTGHDSGTDSTTSHIVPPSASLELNMDRAEVKTSEPPAQADIEKQATVTLTDDFAPLVMVRKYRQIMLEEKQQPLLRQNQASAKVLKETAERHEMIATLAELEGDNLPGVANFFAAMLRSYQEFKLPESNQYDSNWFESALLYLKIVERYYQVTDAAIQVQMLPLVVQLKVAIITSLEAQMHFMGEKSKIEFAHKYGEAIEGICQSFDAEEILFLEHYRITEGLPAIAEAVLPEDSKEMEVPVEKPLSSELENKEREYNKAIENLIQNFDQQSVKREDFSGCATDLAVSAQHKDNPNQQEALRIGIRAILLALETLPGKEWVVSTQQIVQGLVKEATELAVMYEKLRAELSVGQSQASQAANRAVVVAGAQCVVYSYAAMQLNSILNLLRIKAAVLDDNSQRKPEKEPAYVKELGSHQSVAHGLFKSNLEGIIRNVCQTLAGVWGQEADALPLRAEPVAQPLVAAPVDIGADNLQSFNAEFGAPDQRTPITRSLTFYPLKRPKEHLGRGVTFMSSPEIQPDGIKADVAGKPPQSAFARSLSMDPVRLAKVRDALFGKGAKGQAKEPSTLEKVAGAVFKRTFSTPSSRH